MNEERSEKKTRASPSRGTWARSTLKIVGLKESKFIIKVMKDKVQTVEVPSKQPPKRGKTKKPVARLWYREELLEFREYFHKVSERNMRKTKIVILLKHPPRHMAPKEEKEPRREDVASLLDLLEQFEARLGEGEPVVAVFRTPPGVDQ